MFIINEQKNVNFVLTKNNQNPWSTLNQIRTNFETIVLLKLKLKPAQALSVFQHFYPAYCNSISGGNKEKIWRLNNLDYNVKISDRVAPFSHAMTRLYRISPQKCHRHSLALERTFFYSDLRYAIKTCNSCKHLQINEQLNQLLVFSSYDAHFFG